MKKMVCKIFYISLHKTKTKFNLPHDLKMLNYAYLS